MYVELKNINKNFGSYKASNNISFGIEFIIREMINDNTFTGWS